MKSAYVLAALLLCTSPVFAASAFFDDYEEVFDDTALRSCIVPVLEGFDLHLSVTVEVDQTERVSTRYCPGGILMNVPYERHLWVRDQSLEGVTGAYREIGMLLLSNYAELIEVFEPTSPNTPSLNLDRVQFVPGWTTNYVTEANKYLKYDITRQNKFPAVFAAEMYALGTGSVGGGSFYNTATQEFVDQDDFANADLGYPPEDLSNPAELAENGGTCGGFKCVKTAQFDVDVQNEAGSAFFAFTPDLDYYYYPFFVKGVNYVVRAYEGTGSNATEIYTRSGFIPATSTDVFFPEVTSPSYVPRTRIDDNFFNFGSQIRFSGEVASMPETADSASVAFSMVLYRNPLYRHESPADASWYFENISSSSALLDVDGLNDVKLSWARHFNLSSFSVNTTTQNLDNSTPSNDFDFAEDDGSGPQLPDGPSNASNSFGVDWSRDPNAGGGLQGQFEYAQGLMTAQNKHSFFEGLAAIMDAIFRIVLAVFLIAALFVTVFAFFILVPSAYRKLIAEMKRLGDTKWG